MTAVARRSAVLHGGRSGHCEGHSGSLQSRMALACYRYEMMMASTYARQTRRPSAPFRLLQQHVQDLRDVASGTEEGDAGLCCSYLVDAASGEGADYDEHALTALERFVDRGIDVDVADVGWVPVVRQWRARIIRCRRALRRLRERGDHQHASVLYVAHGHADPIVAQLAPLATLPPELRSLVRYTAATEEWRRAMVSAAARAVASDGAVDLAQHKALLARHERQISSGDAMRNALAPFCEAASCAEARKARKVAHDDRQRAFVAAAQREALLMLSSAECAYYAAWLTVARS